MPPPPTAPAVQASIAALQRRAGAYAPTVAVLLGTGWQGFADRVADPVDVPYGELPAFPAPGVAGHAGMVRFGRLAGRDVLLLSGREHAYETGRVDGMQGVIRTLAGLGIGTLVQTNAAGSLDEALCPGALMLVADHLNLPQRSPLVGEPDERRFVDMANAYDAALRQRARAAARAAGVDLHEGVYAWMLGPQFETPAEIRMLQRLGAQAVGMSTVPETILARHAGLRVLALSLITNLGCGLSAQALSHAHTLAGARAAADRAAQVLAAIVASL